MTILEKIETYGYYFMDLATEEEVAQYWELVDGVRDQREEAAAAAEIAACEVQFYEV